MIKDEILKLKNSNLSYRQIAKFVGCAVGTVCYHLNSDFREKQLKKMKNREKQIIKNKNPLWIKINEFKKRKHKNIKENSYKKYNFKDVIKKFSDNPKCYLTGENIDLFNTSTYHFDHIIPVSKGGNNSLDNLGICIPQANKCKSDLTPKQLIELCEKILLNNGFKVEKPST